MSWAPLPSSCSSCLSPSSSWTILAPDFPPFPPPPGWVRERLRRHIPLGPMPLTGERRDIQSAAALEGGKVHSIKRRSHSEIENVFTKKKKIDDCNNSAWHRAAFTADVSHASLRSKGCLKFIANFMHEVYAGHFYSPLPCPRAQQRRTLGGHLIGCLSQIKYGTTLCDAVLIPWFQNHPYL